ncbi:MAG: hypothetical protein K8F24_12535 [Bacteroidales bacterium]|nr:hypothetical protein [Bacteroidales bacterium]
MDSILHIKDNLISRIKSSNDLDFLKALQTIFDSSEQELYKLTPEQEKSIELGRQDILSGNFRTHEQVMKETKEWLEKL